MDIATIQAAVHHYFENGLAPATQRCYRAGQQSYAQFCTQANVTQIPTSESTLSLFIAHLARTGLAHSTIKVYLSSIGNLHLSCNHHHEYRRSLTPRLEQILRGIKREQACTRPARVRLPVTVDIMHSIYSILSKTPNQYQAIMLWAACCIAFFGFLRVGEMTVPTQTAFNDSVHLSLQDIALDSRSAPTIVWLTIKQSKTDPFREGARLCLGLTDSTVCPVKALLPYLALRGSDPGPLFCLENKTPLTRVHFKNLLSTTLRIAGFDDSLYNTHSFRIGAATSAKEVGISDAHIQLLGRWRSSTFQTYIRTPTTVLMRLSKQLVSVPGTEHDK